MAKLVPSIASDTGTLKKKHRKKTEIFDHQKDREISRALDDPNSSFDINLLDRQIFEECVEEYRKGNDYGASYWGDYDHFSQGQCTHLIVRIRSIRTSPSLSCIFGDDQGPDIIEKIDEFVESGSTRVLRISLSNLSYEHRAREIVVNAIGRHLLARKRKDLKDTVPTVVILDEAHNFLAGSLGTHEERYKLNSFELIAREGRKYGLNLCLATQRPRDLTEGVLSQMGTLIVHRLTNHLDREIVERACGEIDRSASAFLPNLQPGEAALIGVDFPIPLTIKIDEPKIKPQSSGADYQKHWALDPSTQKEQ